MDLKHFHYVFIAFAILCTLGFGLWALFTGSAVFGTWGRVGGALSVLIGLGLVAYGIWFVRKARNIVV